MHQALKRLKTPKIPFSAPRIEKDPPKAEANGGAVDRMRRRSGHVFTLCRSKAVAIFRATRVSSVGTPSLIIARFPWFPMQPLFSGVLMHGHLFGWFVAACRRPKRQAFKFRGIAPRDYANSHLPSTRQCGRPSLSSSQISPEVLVSLFKRFNLSVLTRTHIASALQLSNPTQSISHTSNFARCHPELVQCFPR